MTEQIASSSNGPEREGVKLLFSGDVARLRGVSVPQARKCLVDLEAKHGGAVVGYVGRRRFTTEAALLTIAPPWRGPTNDPETRIRALETGLAEMTRRFRVAESHAIRLRALESRLSYAEAKFACP